MKKYTPYILPAIVLGIVLLLIFRWYSTRTQPVSSGELFGEGVQIENLTDQEAMDVMTSSSTTIKTVEMTGDVEGTATLRYEVEGERVLFSVIANLPEPETGYYVWLKEVEGDALRRAFVLDMGKGGYVGSAALPAELLPFEVIVSSSDSSLTVMDEVLFRGVATP